MLWQREGWQNSAPVRAVIFDMDGVIFDTERLAETSWYMAAQRLGYKEMTHEVFLQTLGAPRESVHKALAAHFGENVDLEAMGKVRREAMDELIAQEGMPIKAGFIELMGHLKGLGVKTAIASATWQTRIREYFVLANLDIDALFNAVISGDMVQRGKPAPDIFLKAAGDIGSAPGECIVIEDSFGGVRAGYDAGMRVIMVPDMLEPTQEVQRMLCARVDTLEDIIALI